MQYVLHRKLMTRLLTAWLVLYVVLGGWVYYVELREIDEVVLEMATMESNIFTGESIRALHARNLKENPQLYRYADDLLKQHFLAVELYDARRNMLLAHVRSDAVQIEDALSESMHKFPSSDTVVHEKHLINGRYFLRVLLPLIDQPGTIGGYFEGVYEVEEETLEAIHERAYGAVILSAIRAREQLFLIFDGLAKLAGYMNCAMASRWRSQNASRSR